MIPPTAGAGLVLGGDVGGTSTRIVVADLAGRVVARGLGPGGNPVAHPETARDAFAAALTEALAPVDPAAVRAAVVGMAGSGAFRDPATRDGFLEIWHGAGLPGTPDVRSDLEVAFAAGTQDRDGSVLIAGTGAVAGLLAGGRLVGSSGGHGWLLGDEGSGFWIGREAVRATLRALAGIDPAGPLSELVLAEVGVDRDDPAARNDLVAAAYSRSPVGLAEMSPLVTRAHTSADPVATAILDAAAGHLLATWEALAAPRGDPVVLAGSLLRAGSRLGDSVRAGLRERSVPFHPAEDPVTGAVRLALRVLNESD